MIKYPPVGIFLNTFFDPNKLDKSCLWLAHEISYPIDIYSIRSITLAYALNFKKISVFLSAMRFYNRKDLRIHFIKSFLYSIRCCIRHHFTKAKGKLCFTFLHLLKYGFYKITDSRLPIMNAFAAKISI